MDLSSTYSALYRGSIINLLRNGTSFCYHVYKTGKFRELCSFIIWEFMYKLGYFNKSKTLQFTPDLPYSINDITLGLKPTSSKVDKGLSIVASCINWRYCFEDHLGHFWGCEYENSTTLVKSTDGISTTFIAKFPSAIRSLYISKLGKIFVCADGCLYRGSIMETTFTKVLRLSSSKSYFLFNRGMTELPDGTLLLGEYASIWTNGNWTQLANLFIGTDEGRNWEKSDFLIRQGVNKHIHLVQYATYLDKVFLTDGDNKKQIWQNISGENLTDSYDIGNAGWQLINKRHIQMGGYTSMAEYEGGVIFGTDYLGGTNFIVHTSTGDHFDKVVVPDPYRRSPLINMATRQVGNSKEIWALLHNSITPSAKCLVMYSRDNGSTWTRLIEYNGCDYEVQLVSSSHGQSKTIFFCIRHIDNGTEYSQTYRITTHESGH